MGTDDPITPPDLVSVSDTGLTASPSRLVRQAQLRRAFAARLLKEAEALDNIVAGIEVLQGPGDTGSNGAPSEGEHSTAPTGAVPTQAPAPGTEAVRAVMREGGVWNSSELHRELERRGWVAEGVQHPRKATETALNRLYQKYLEVERVGRGRYRYKRTPTGQAAVSQLGSAP
jgi:hypothetical protein